MDFENAEHLYLWCISLCIFLFLIDDLFIDFIAYFKKLKPTAISQDRLFDSKNTKLLAVMIANWKEENVLEEMVHGNMARLQNNNVHFFLGVYPNDLPTLEIALRMEKLYPRVHAVINSKEGPTYKGQMLNEVIQYIFDSEKKWGVQFDGFVLHDSEDILDSRIPYLYSLGLKNADFVQTPVFSLPVGLLSLVGGTYMDEFAEIHTKDLLVRQYLGAAIPSAGVGTCLSRRLLLNFHSKQNGEVFLPDSLTEDYQLGLQTTKWGFKSTFLCHFVEGEKPSQIISTREFFPHKFWQSIRQKTRWTTGIAFQGFANIGWFGNFWQRYFLWRDRKGPLNAFLTFNLLFTLVLVPLDWQSSSPLHYLLIVNTMGMLMRLCVRMDRMHSLYGISKALTCVLRWPVAMMINMISGLRSTAQYLESSITGKKIIWVKTEHRLPEGFGDIVFVPATAKTPLNASNPYPSQETNPNAEAL